jgi:hypothetical protein
MLAFKTDLRSPGGSALQGVQGNKGCGGRSGFHARWKRRRLLDRAPFHPHSKLAHLVAELPVHLRQLVKSARGPAGAHPAYDRHEQGQPRDDRGERRHRAIGLLRGSRGKVRTRFRRGEPPGAPGRARRAGMILPPAKAAIGMSPLDCARDALSETRRARATPLADWTRCVMPTLG